MRSLRRLRLLTMTLLAVCAFQPPPVFSVEETVSLQASFLRGEYELVVQRSTALLEEPTGRKDELLYLRGVSALKLRDWEESRASLNRLLKEYPASRWGGQAGLAIGDSWVSSGDDDKARQVFSRLASEGKANPLFPQILLRLGKVEQRLGQWGAAKASFDRLIQEAPNSSEAVLVRGILRQGDFFFTVQVGAFVTRGNALKLQSELRRRGYDAEITEADSQGQIFHRVRVGQFVRREEAEAEVRHLQQEGFPAKIFP